MLHASALSPLSRSSSCVRAVSVDSGPAITDPASHALRFPPSMDSLSSCGMRVSRDARVGAGAWSASAAAAAAGRVSASRGTGCSHCTGARGPWMLAVLHPQVVRQVPEVQMCKACKRPNGLCDLPTRFQSWRCRHGSETAAHAQVLQVCELAECCTECREPASAAQVLCGLHVQHVQSQTCQQWEPSKLLWQVQPHGQRGAAPVGHIEIAQQWQGCECSSERGSGEATLCIV
jgi:hypothetical protein